MLWDTRKRIRYFCRASDVKKAFIKAELEKIGRERIEKSSGQSFYRAVKSHYKSMDKEALIKKSFGENWKEIILSLPNNTPETIKYLENI